MIYRLEKMENSRNLHRLGKTSYGMLVARYLWKLKSETEKKKKKIKMQGQRNFGGVILKRILDEIKIRLKKVENLRTMINDTKAPNGKNWESWILKKKEKLMRCKTRMIQFKKVES